MKKLIYSWLALSVLAFSASAQTLTEYQEMAAKNNPGLKAEYKTFEASLERIPQVGSLPDPTLSFGYFISPVETRVGPQRARFSLSQMFPWFGTLQSRKDAAALEADAKYQQFVDSRNKLFFEVAAAYYPLYELEEWIEIEKENIRILKSFKTIATQKFESGSGKMVDVLRAEIRIEDAETNLRILQQERIPLRTRFNKLLNRSADEQVLLPDTLEIDDSMLSTRIADSTWLEHPRLEAIRHQVEASKDREKAARKSGLPSIGAGLDYMVIGERPGADIAENGKDALMPMVSVSIPIFRGKYQAAQREAQLMQESYDFEEQAIKNDLLTDWEQAVFEISRERERIQLYQRQINTTQQTLNLLLKAYSNEGEDFEEILLAHRELLQYQKEIAAALVGYHIAIARLDYITSKNR